MTPLRIYKNPIPFGQIELMSACAEHINMTGIHINRYLAKCLYCICMEQNLVFLCNLSNFSDRLDRSDLIICKHHRNKDRIRTNRFFSSSSFTTPFSSTSRYVISNPRCFSRYSHVCRIAWCSIFVVMICFPFFSYASAVAFSAQLSDLAPLP